MPLADTFRERLADAIEADPRKRYMIAREAGYSETYIRRVLKGTQANPTLAFTEAMAQTLGVPLLWIIGADKD